MSSDQKKMSQLKRTDMFRTHASHKIARMCENLSVVPVSLTPRLLTQQKHREAKSLRVDGTLILRLR